jgi:hypothetical protein
MDRSDTVKSLRKILYLCLPDWQRNCRCSIVDLMAGRDCGVVLPEPKRKRQ